LAWSSLSPAVRASYDFDPSRLQKTWTASGGDFNGEMQQQFARSINAPLVRSLDRRACMATKMRKLPNVL
jgi:hypothetical protein